MGKLLSGNLMLLGDRRGSIILDKKVMSLEKKTFCWKKICWKISRLDMLLGNIKIERYCWAILRSKDCCWKVLRSESLVVEKYEETKCCRKSCREQLSAKLPCVLCHLEILK